MRMLPFLAALVGTILLPLAANAAGTIEVSDAWARPATANGAAYFTLSNKSDINDTLISASSPIAKSSSLHESVNGNDDISRMESLSSVPLSAGEQIIFKPKGKHVMLMGLSQPLVEGTTFPITLTFEKAGSKQIIITVRQTSADEAASGMSGHNHHMMH